jgi:hypothetical protein
LKLRNCVENDNIILVYAIKYEKSVAHVVAASKGPNG